jgi:hypothetical protein
VKVADDADVELNRCRESRDKERETQREREREEHQELQRDDGGRN